MKKYLLIIPVAALGLAGCGSSTHKVTTATTTAIASSGAGVIETAPTVDDTLPSPTPQPKPHKSKLHKATPRSVDPFTKALADIRRECTPPAGTDLKSWLMAEYNGEDPGQVADQVASEYPEADTPEHTQLLSDTCLNALTSER